MKFYATFNTLLCIHDTESNETLFIPSSNSLHGASLLADGPWRKGELITVGGSRNPHSMSKITNSSKSTNNEKGSKNFLVRNDTHMSSQEVDSPTVLLLLSLALEFSK